MTASEAIETIISLGPPGILGAGIMGWLFWMQSKKPKKDPADQIEKALTGIRDDIKEVKDEVKQVKTDMAAGFRSVRRDESALAQRVSAVEAIQKYRSDK